MPEFVATFTRMSPISVSFQAANEAEAAKLADAMTLALEATEPSDVAVTKIYTAAAYEDYLEGLREIEPDPPMQ